MTLTTGFHARDAMRLPGIISLARIPLAIAFPFAIPRAPVAATLLGAAAATDVLDGWVARRRHDETATGAILDAVADKAFVLAVVSALALRKRLRVRDVMLLSTRELIEAPLAVREWWEITHATHASRATRKRERRALPLGKVTTTLQFVTLLCVVLRVRHRTPLTLAGIAGVAAGLVYAARERSARRSKHHANAWR